ncbi:cation diffusion facilitator family transporter [Flavobacterium sp. SUN046]|uniref:cation diffusion facilitator family transporter n=1 Tax=Flavobacterium sp. SUN046 TaxID=3002440 RepID=UPI002DB95456|nr:cation diffusion facilitator family transporter [Flavobacterium sp. SUN046]MEC4048378.1 cation diffusion facilitator family transporter [Flavobacterium sp. SUN046]
MDHHHHHNHQAPVLKKVTNAFVVGIVLNLFYVVVQVGIGLKINSLSLLSDAGHNFLDVAALALSLLAFKLARMRVTKKYTYGYKKASILISLFNAVILLVSIGAIIYESIHRFQNPQALPGITIAIVALIGTAINGISAFMFFKDKEKDLNIKSAFLHLIADALFSLGIVAGGIAIYYTQLYWIDPLLSVVICLIIIYSTWDLLKDSLRLSLDGVPIDINIENIESIVGPIDGVISFHHLHVWAMSTTENAMTAHLVVSNSLSNQEIINIKKQIKHELEHVKINHVTLEIELENEICSTPDCNNL